MSTSAQVTRLYAEAKRRVNSIYRNPSFVGPVLHRALVAQEILNIVAAQDDSIPAENVRALANGLHAMLDDDTDFS